MPTRDLFHNTPTFSGRTLNSPGTNSLPNPYNSPILESDLMAFPAGGIKNTNTLDELRRSLNQITKDKKTYLDGLQAQVSANDTDIDEIDVNLDEIKLDLVNVAKDLQRKAWDEITIVPGTGLSTDQGVADNAETFTGGAVAGVNLQGDIRINLDIAQDNELGGVLSNDAQIITNSTAESAINGHIEVDASGNVKIKDNAIELGEKTRGDYIFNITSNTPDGITLTGGTGEKTTTDLKLTERITAATKGLSTDAEEVDAFTATAGKIRKVKVPKITYNKFGQLTTVTEMNVNSANNYDITVIAGNALTTGGTVTQNHGAAQSITIDHSPAVSTLANTTFTSDTPGSGYGNYSPGFAAGTGKINFPETLGAMTFDTFGHVKQVTKRTLTYGLNSPLPGITDSTEPYTPGNGANFDLNIPTEADFTNLVNRVLTLQDNRVLIPAGTGSIQLERNVDVTGATGGSGHLHVTGNLTTGDSPNGTNALLKTDKTTRKVGINIGNTAPQYSLQVIGQADSDITGAFTGNTMVYNRSGTSRAYGFTSVSTASTMFGGNLRFDDSVTTGTHPGYAKGTNARGSAAIIMDNEHSDASQIHGEFRFVTAQDTNDDTWTVVERMRINTAGNVGIGTDYIQAKLHVNGDIAIGAGGGSDATNPSSDSPMALLFGSTRNDTLTSTLAHTAIASRRYSSDTPSEKSELLLFKGNDGGTSAGPDRIRHRAAEHVFQTYTSPEFFYNGAIGTNRYAVNDDNTRFFIGNDGRVGIGTTSPTAKLHVQAANPGTGGNNSAADSPSARFDSTVICEGDMVVKGDFNLQNGITFDNWNIQATTGNVTAGGTQHFTNVENAQSPNDTPSLRVEGGAVINKDLFVNGNTQLGNTTDDTVGFGSNQLVFGKMGPDDLYGIAYGSGVANQSVVLNDSPFSDRWRIYQSKSMPGRNEDGSLFEEYIHIDGTATSTLTNPANDYLVFEKQDGNQQFTDGGFAFITNGRDGNNNNTQRSKKLLRMKHDGAKFYQDLEVAGDLSIAGGLTTTGSSGLTLTGDTGLTGNLTVNGNTTLGDAAGDTTTVSGDFIAGNSGAADTNKLFFDTSDGRLGIGKLNPAYTVDAIGDVRFTGDVISDGGAGGAQFTANFGTGKVMTLLHGSTYGVVGTTGATDVGIRTNGTDRIRITSAGKVGIGTTSPNANFALTINGSTRNEGNIFVGGADIDLNASPRRTLTSNSDTTHEEPSGDTRRRALVHNFGDRLELNYNNDYTGGTKIGTQYFFDNNGRLGMGTGSPEARLHITGGNSEQKLLIQNVSTSHDPMIQLANVGDLTLGGSNGENAGWAMRMDTSEGNQLDFRYNNNRRLSIETGGAVGIGTSSPRGKLEIAGAQYVTGSAPNIVFNETGVISDDNTPASDLDNHGYFRLILNSGSFRINRNTHETSEFSSQDDAFICHHNGNVSLGSINSVPYDDGTTTGTVNYRPLSIISTHTDEPDNPERAYIQSSLPRFVVGSTNIFDIHDKFASEQRIAFATRADGADVPTRRFQDGKKNYSNSMKTPGVGNTNLGFTVLNTDDVNDVGQRGTTIHSSANLVPAMELNQNSAVTPIMELNNQGVTCAQFSVSKTANGFSLSTRKNTGGEGQSGGLGQRISVNNGGAIKLHQATKISSRSGAATSAVGTNVNYCLQLDAQSSNDSHLLLGNVSSSSGLFNTRGEITASETSLDIINHSEDEDNQKITLKPDNTEQFVLTPDECEIKPISTKVQTLSAAGAITSGGILTATQGNFRSYIYVHGDNPYIRFHDWSDGVISHPIQDAPYISGNRDGTDQDLKLIAPGDGGEIMFRTKDTYRLYLGQDVSEDAGGSASGGAKVNGDLLVAGDISATGDVVAFQTSDKRFKDNITPIKDATSKVNKLSGNTFDWNEKGPRSGNDIGVIAQEVQEIIPSAVRENDEGYLQVEYTKIVPLLIESIKELSAKVQELEAKLK